MNALDNPLGHFERPITYDCVSEGHIYGRWQIASPREKWRKCVIPGCGHVVRKRVT